MGPAALGVLVGDLLLLLGVAVSASGVGFLAGVASLGLGALAGVATLAGDLLPLLRLVLGDATAGLLLRAGVATLGVFTGDLLCRCSVTGLAVGDAPFGDRVGEAVFVGVFFCAGLVDVAGVASPADAGCGNEAVLLAGVHLTAFLGEAGLTLLLLSDGNCCLTGVVFKDAGLALLLLLPGDFAGLFFTDAELGGFSGL